MRRLQGLWGACAGGASCQVGSLRDEVFVPDLTSPALVPLAQALDRSGGFPVSGKSVLRSQSRNAGNSASICATVRLNSASLISCSGWRLVSSCVPKSCLNRSRSAEPARGPPMLLTAWNRRSRLVRLGGMIMYLLLIVDRDVGAPVCGDLPGSMRISGLLGRSGRHF